jgi:hypothetical protein
MIGFLCFVLAVVTSPFKSRLRLEAESAALHQLMVLRRRLQGHEPSLVLYPNCIAGFHRSCRCQPSSGPRRSCVGTGPVFAANASEAAIFRRPTVNRYRVARRTAAIKSKKSQKSLSGIGNRRAISLRVAESHFPNVCRTRRRQGCLGKRIQRVAPGWGGRDRTNGGIKIR